MIYPQEIEVWYVLPTIRKELSEELVKQGLSQKEIALKLRLTEAAVSQYINEKRANKSKLDNDMRNAIQEAAKRIINNASIMKEIQDLSKLFWQTRAICKIHMRHDKSISKNCKLCFE